MIVVHDTNEIFPSKVAAIWPSFRQLNTATFSFWECRYAAGHRVSLLAFSSILALPPPLPAPPNIRDRKTQRRTRCFPRSPPAARRQHRTVLFGVISEALTRLVCDPQRFILSFVCLCSKTKQPGHELPSPRICRVQGGQPKHFTSGNRKSAGSRAETGTTFRFEPGKACTGRGAQQPVTTLFFTAPLPPFPLF